MIENFSVFDFQLSDEDERDKGSGQKDNCFLRSSRPEWVDRLSTRTLNI